MCWQEGSQFVPIEVHVRVAMNTGRVTIFFVKVIFMLRPRATTLSVIKRNFQDNSNDLRLKTNILQTCLYG